MRPTEAHLLDTPKWQRLTLASAGEEEEDLELWHTAGGM